MATQTPDKITDIGRLSPTAQSQVIKLATGMIQKRNEFNEIYNKMDAIDIAYARYQALISKEETASGEDVRRIGDTCCDVFASDNVIPPIVVSQVDTYVAYLAEVFLSGSPIFPVVSPPAKRQAAEILESLIDDHSTLGAYPRQLLMFIRDACKYNIAAIETDWTSIDQFSVLDDVAATNGQSMQRKPKKFTAIKRLNMRNVVWDWSVAPGDVSCEGDYAGHISIVSKLKLKRLLNKWSKDNKAYNIDKAMASSNTNTTGGFPNFKHDPIISDYMTSTAATRNAAPTWDTWFDGTKKQNGGPPSDAQYELFTVYVRILPSDMAINAPMPNTPQIWKFVICNSGTLVFADRIISAYDYLPILFGQPLEDGLGYQTQSIAEGEIPFQKAASTLFNIRFAAARRAVSDRALYNSDMIKPSDINSKVPAPKIPVSISQLSTKTLSDAYHQIPFDMRGTETTLQDASMIVGFSQQLHGINKPRQGEFQKGNKSVQEWNDTMGGSDGRMRLPALTLEHQVFSPLKSIISLNIFQHGEDGIVVSYRSGEAMEYKISQIRAANLTFQIADGYTPKSKLASTDVLLSGMQFIQQSPILQASFGASLPGMFIHFMSLSGAKGFEQYDPKYAANAEANNNAAINNLAANSLVQSDPNAQQGAPGQGQPSATPPVVMPIPAQPQAPANAQVAPNSVPVA